MRSRISLRLYVYPFKFNNNNDFYSLQILYDISNIGILTTVLVDVIELTVTI